MQTQNDLNNNLNHETPFGFSLLRFFLVLATLGFLLSNLLIQETASALSAVAGLVAMIFLLIFISKKVEEGQMSQAYSLLIGGTLLLDFALFSSCLINFTLKIH